MCVQCAVCARGAGAARGTAPSGAPADPPPLSNPARVGPHSYVAAKHSYDEAWPLKTDDFFPYADAAHSYWTGYFTSRAASKRLIRGATSYLQAARQLEAFVGPERKGEGRAAGREGGLLGGGGRALAGRAASARAAQLSDAPRESPPAGPSTDALEEAVSLCQHHDSVTGTEKQHVANDYHRRLHRGEHGAVGGPVSLRTCTALSCLMEGRQAGRCLRHA